MPSDAYNQKEEKLTTRKSLSNLRAKPSCRIFVNRSLHLEQIKFYGFDMDYTLAEYTSPHYEALGFNLVKQHLVTAKGYPPEILRFDYDPFYPVRGLWFDMLYGNLLKVDAYGNILSCMHGFKFLKTSEVYELYPNKFVSLEDRVYVLNTLFNLPETYLVACVIDFFNGSPDYQNTSIGVRCGDQEISYRSIFLDIRGSVDDIHHGGDFQQKTIKTIEKYLKRDDRLATLLMRLREGGAKTFIITNSPFQFTHQVMSYLLEIPGMKTGPQIKDWKSYFDWVVVDAKKPTFFGEGTILRKIDVETGALKMGYHVGPLEKGCLYAGGSSEGFTQMIGATGKDVLYCGDHIFGDILKSKKTGWRTFLVIPELVHELEVWQKECKLFAQLQDLDYEMAKVYKDLDSSTKEKPDISKIRGGMRAVTRKMELSYGQAGSLFRSGSHQTFFSSQVMRYADLYSASVVNLLYYPFSYMFRAPAQLLPHESTVAHELEVNLDATSTAMVLRKEAPKVFRSHSILSFSDSSLEKGKENCAEPGSMFLNTQAAQTYHYILTMLVPSRRNLGIENRYNNQEVLDNQLLLPTRRLILNAKNLAQISGDVAKPHQKRYVNFHNYPSIYGSSD